MPWLCFVCWCVIWDGKREKIAAFSLIAWNVINFLGLFVLGWSKKWMRCWRWLSRREKMLRDWYIRILQMQRPDFPVMLKKSPSSADALTSGEKPMTSESCIIIIMMYYWNLKSLLLWHLSWSRNIWIDQRCFFRWLYYFITDNLQVMRVLRVVTWGRVMWAT